jgi:uncharacterized protein YdeI (YjbR/CyaY-like superfamily)
MTRDRRQLRTFAAQTLEEWRAWLGAHHDSESEVWLVFPKAHTGRPSVSYSDALDEALCFGWIDSLVRRLDESRYARKFTPRKPDSAWSAVNRERYAKLEASGRLQPGGRARSPVGQRLAVAPAKKAWVLRPYMAAALRKRPAAWKHFQALSPEQRRRYVGWVDSARREETKQRRLAEAVKLLSEGKRLGLK